MLFGCIPGFGPYPTPCIDLGCLCMLGTVRSGILVGLDLGRIDIVLVGWCMFWYVDFWLLWLE